MKQKTGNLRIQTHGQGLVMITQDLANWVLYSGIDTGLLTLWCRHTSASLIVQENADPSVCRDIVDYFNDLVPENREYMHDDEGPDDMPAHLKTVLTQTSLSIPVFHGRLTLGIWQGVYLFEHRNREQVRELALHILGE